MTADAPKSRVIPANEYQRERWRNGLGWTREIHAEPMPPAAGARHADALPSADWAWRLSIAEIERDAPFSTFPGVERELMLLGGNGLRLRFDDAEGGDVLLEPPHGRVRFAGERAVTGELVDGRTHDFNLMWRRGHVSADMLLRPLVGPMVFFAEPRSTWALHLIVGDARFDAASGLPMLHTGDTALLAAATRTRFLLEGGGTLLAVRLDALSI